MNQQALIYKRYHNQIKHSSILLLKQQHLAKSQKWQQNKFNDERLTIRQKNINLSVSNSLNNSIVLQSNQDKSVEPLVLKKFQEYFTKNIQPIRNIKIFNQIIKTNLNIKNSIKSKIRGQVSKKLSPPTTKELLKIIEKDISIRDGTIVVRDKTIDTSYSKSRKEKFQVTRDRQSNLSLSQSKRKMKNILQQREEIDLNNVNVSTSAINRNRKRQKINNSIDLSRRLNYSIDLSKLINSQVMEKYQNQINKQLRIIEQKHLRQSQQLAEEANYLRIEKSFLTQRKYISTQLNFNETKSPRNQEELKKAIRTKITHRKKMLQETYKDNIRGRSPSPVKFQKVMNFINILNPLGKTQFSLIDLLKVSMTNSLIDQVKLNMNGCFFTVFVQDGNNSQLIKTIVRSISGWRVVQIPSVANLVWTQSYRKNLIQKKPKQIIRDEITENQREQSISKQKITEKERINFLLSKQQRLSKKNSNQSFKSGKKSSQKKIASQQDKNLLNSSGQTGISNATTELFHKGKKEEYSYENQVKKLLPDNFNVEKYTVKKQKQIRKLTINPNFIIHNHLIGHKAISDKKNLLFNLRKYYSSIQANPFTFIPESHQVKSLQDQFIEKQNQKYLRTNASEQMKKEVWIIKPGQDSNRGRGIMICKGWEQVIKQISKRVQKSQNYIKNESEQCAYSDSKTINGQNGAKKNQIQVTLSKMVGQKSRKSSKLFNTATDLNQCNLQKNSINGQNLMNSTGLVGRKKEKTTIIQRYLVPFLYNGRKFDIRSYMLVTWVNNSLNAYVYEECYIRTSSKQFDLDSQNKYVHLTNDAIQCMSHQYGKFEEGNKVAQVVFQKYFNESSEKVNIKWRDIRSEMSQRCKDIVRSSSRKLVGMFGSKQSVFRQTLGYNIDSYLLNRGNQTNRSESLGQTKKSLFMQNLQTEKQTQMSFQLFGLDFMIDQNLKLWLIEVNTNPAITHDCSRVLNKLIPRLIQNTFEVAVMPYMKPSRTPQTSICHNKYRHIYQQIIQAR